MSNIIIRVNYKWYNKSMIEKKIKTIKSIVEERLTYVNLEYFDDTIDGSFFMRINNVYTILFRHLTECKFYNLYKYISHPDDLREYLISKNFISNILKEDLETNIENEFYEEAEEIKKLIELNERR